LKCLTVGFNDGVKVEECLNENSIKDNSILPKIMVREFMNKLDTSSFQMSFYGDYINPIFLIVSSMEFAKLV
jgi:hypothetical protein